MRSTVFVVVLLAGCSDAPNAPNIPRALPALGMKRVNVNGVVITSYDGSQTVNGYRGHWQGAQYSVQVWNRRSAMDSILQSVRVNSPDRDYYTRKPPSWPADSSIQGVLRGPASGGSQAQFEIQSSAGFVFTEFHSETNCLNEDFFASFFGNTTIDVNSYKFPDDGAGHIEKSALYPTPENLP